VQTDFAGELLQRHLVGAARQLVALCRGGGGDGSRASGKEEVRVLILRMQQCLSGLRSGLPDLPHAGLDLPGEDLSVSASVRSKPPWWFKFFLHLPSPRRQHVIKMSGQPLRSPGGGGGGWKRVSRPKHAFKAVDGIASALIQSALICSYVGDLDCRMCPCTPPLYGLMLSDIEIGVLLVGFGDGGHSRDA